MPTWNEINNEIDELQDEKACDVVRQKYLEELEAYVGRPVIAYYSGFLQKRDASGQLHPESAITDLDMNGLMAVIHNIQRDKGLDVIIHTPGGGIEATRAIVEYLYKMFGQDVRAIVPHMAMSAGTMIACASRQIVMGKHSCLGPTDPQVRGLPAMGVLAELDRAIAEIKAEPLKQIIWSQVFSKYPPAFIMDCERQVEGSREMVAAWLKSNMLRGEEKATEKAKAIVSGLMDYKGTTEHSHHFLIDKCRAIGLHVLALEDDQDLQEAVLSVHHSYVATFARTNAIKIIENAIGANWTVSA
ncbi:SDH family Clp fold serine proteinase [Sinorhizobium americanum]|uniref:SDH family Clp fold serine proteinase n=1 Tax=Sinorhizobium americanum TaxID=194963 RepID=UPI00056AD76B|nr:ATP-dependent Clp protease proteolytic subunit [Sinorhizobium americanum]